MSTSINTQLSIPASIMETVDRAHEAFFGNTLTEAILLENQRQIDAMSRDNMYKAMAANFIGGWPTDWNSPSAASWFNRMHDAFNMLAKDMYEDAKGRARSAGMNMPDQVEGQFRNRSGNELTVRDVTLNQIRSAILNFEAARAPGSTVTKFMPGIVRISLLKPCYGGCGMQTDQQDSRRLKLLKAFIMYLSEVSPDPEAPDAEYDVNLNGETLDEILGKYGNAIQDIIRSAREDINNYQSPEGNTPGHYTIKQIHSFQEATQYANFNQWCICEGPMYWDTYSLEGTNTVYFCLRDGWENEPAVAGENAPLDEYGLSMICVIVDEDGDMATSTTRWNDANDGTDWALTPQKITDLIGQPFHSAFPPNPQIPEYMQQARQYMQRQ